MAQEDVRRGLPFAGLGVALFIALIIVTSSWHSARNRADALGARESSLLTLCFATLVIVLAFELLRLATAFAERFKGDRAPRVLASLFLPAVTWLIGASPMAQTDAAWVEASLWAAAALTIGAVPPALVSALDAFMPDTEARATLVRRLFIGYAATVLLAIGIAFVIPHPHTATAAESAGLPFTAALLR